VRAKKSSERLRWLLGVRFIGWLLAGFWLASGWLLAGFWLAGFVEVFVM